MADTVSRILLLEKSGMMARVSTSPPSMFLRQPGA